MLRPRPPSVTGIERKRGTHVKSPHHAKSVAAFMVEQMIMLRPEGAAEKLSNSRSRCLFLTPSFWFSDSPSQPQRDQGRRDARKENGAPSEARHHQPHYCCAKGIPDRPRALYQCQGLGAITGGPGFCDQCSSRSPLSTHAQPQNYSVYHQLCGRLREPAQRRGNRIDHHAYGEGSNSPEAVGKPPEAHTSCSGCDKRGRHHRPTLPSGEMQGALHFTEHERIQHHVHAVEHPAQRGGQQRSLLIDRCLGQPTVDSVQILSACIRVLERPCEVAVTPQYESGGDLRVAIDTGGTFTDCVYLSDGQIRVAKIFSTPADPSRAVLDVLALIGADKNLNVRHGTTVGTNSILERKGARVAFVTTAGFEDTIAIGRQARSRLYDWFAPVPVPLVPRELRFGVPERVSSQGKILRSPTETDLDALANEIRASAAEAVAISLLFSFANPETERRVEAALRHLSIPISTSHRILPEFREYERASTTVVNAYLAPRMQNYLTQLERRVTIEHAGSRVDVMQSSGGIIPAHLAAQEPVRTILSGPAGGVIGACKVACWAGFERIIGFDMGGTSTDVFLSDTATGGAQRSRETLVAGVPVSVPMLDIHTAGAGGGSLARFDSGGLLRVGPESAGADPGPICFGRGILPTVTDANLLLGRLDPDTFLNGGVSLDRRRAERIMLEQKGPLATVQELAAGIVRVVETQMEKAIRVISIERGHDPRQFTLVAFGGGGPLHACSLAQALRIPTVLIPAMPGALSAVGILLADTVRDYSRTVMLPGHALDKLESIFSELESSAAQEFRSVGMEGTVQRTIDVRYRGQAYELNVPCDGQHSVGALAAFHQLHQQRYGFSDFQAQVEVVNLRVRITAAPEPYSPPYRAPVAGDGAAALCSERNIFFNGKFLSSIVYQRERLSPGDLIHGPAMITEYTSATVLQPACSAQVDGYGNLIIAISQEPA